MKSLLILLLLAFPMIGRSADSILAKLGADTAWVGEGVPLLITLRAKGPFSGTASFDLPETAQTFFIKEGGPSVGSETFGGETWLTQLHEFRIYTQKSGEIVIPPIGIRFEAKKDYISDPEPHTGSTQPLSFHSRRPPGAKGMVVSVEELKVQQTWTGGTDEDLKPGDVIIRRITRKANKTTGMIFPDADLSAPDGIQVYAARPEIRDKSYRGETTAERVDEIKYQFSRGGTFALPDLIFSWWDPLEEKLMTATMKGSAFEVERERSSPARDWIWLWLILPVVLIYPVVSKVRKFHSAPERLAVKNVLRAYQQGNPHLVYEAILKWGKPPFGPDFEAEWATLSKAIYSATPAEWNSNSGKAAFALEVKSRKNKQRTKKFPETLSPLNPIQRDNIKTPTGGNP